MFEALNGYSTAGKTNGVDYVVYNGVTYVRSEEYSQSAFSNGATFSLKDIYGMSKVTNSALKMGGWGLTSPNKYEVVTNQYLLYNRTRSNLIFDNRNGHAADHGPQRRVR